MRMCLATIVAVLVQFAGCGSNPPARVTSAPSPAGPADQEATPTSAASEASPSAVDNKPKATEQPIAPSARSAEKGDTTPLDAKLRANLAVLIVPGDAGRWRVAEGPATEFEKSPPEVSQLWLATKESDAAVRRGAWHLLAEKFEAGEEANRQKLREALSDQDAIVRALAFRIVSELPDQFLPEFVPSLGQLISREQLTPENRTAMARLLGRLKERAKGAEESLAEAARSDQQAKVRAACLMALWQIADPAANLPRFRAALQDGDASVRVVAAARLREMATAAAPAAESLAKLLEDRDERVREAAAEALIRIGEPAVKPLIAALASEFSAARRWAVFALAKIGPAAKPALAELEKRSGDEREDEETRKMAALAAKRLQAGN